MDNYVNVVYNEKDRPKTDYPKQLCTYLFEKFNMLEGMKFLEVGCGRGEFLNNFKSLGLDVYGTDLCEEAQSFNPNIDIEISNVEEDGLPYEDETFHVVYSKSFIEHLYHPEKYLTEAHRVLKKGGIFLTLVPDWESNYRTYFDDFTHRTPFTTEALKDYYRMGKFEDINVYRFRQLPITWKYPFMNYVCAAVAPFVHHRIKYKYLRWSKELMVVGYGVKE